MTGAPCACCGCPSLETLGPDRARCPYCGWEGSVPEADVAMALGGASPRRAGEGLLVVGACPPPDEALLARLRGIAGVTDVTVVRGPRHQPL